MLQTPLTIQRLYDDNRDSLQLGWFAGFPGGERQISGDAVSAADQVGHLNLIHPGRMQVFGHQELNYYQRLKSGSRSHLIGELIAGGPPALFIAQGLDTPPDILAICDEQNIPLFSTPLPAAQVIDYLRVYLRHPADAVPAGEHAVPLRARGPSRRERYRCRREDDRDHGRRCDADRLPDAQDGRRLEDLRHQHDGRVDDPGVPPAVRGPAGDGRYRRPHQIPGGS
ncbi:hypothetical protein GCM10025794_18440 [Massilia kyonggiensis]